MLNQAPHVKPIYYTDLELQALSDEICPGAEQARRNIFNELNLSLIHSCSTHNKNLFSRPTMFGRDFFCNKSTSFSALRNRATQAVPPVTTQKYGLEASLSYLAIAAAAYLSLIHI